MVKFLFSLRPICFVEFMSQQTDFLHASTFVLSCMHAHIVHDMRMFYVGHKGGGSGSINVEIAVAMVATGVSVLIVGVVIFAWRFKATKSTGNPTQNDGEPAQSANQPLLSPISVDQPAIDVRVAQAEERVAEALQREHAAEQMSKQLQDELRIAERVNSAALKKMRKQCEAERRADAAKEAEVRVRQDRAMQQLLRDLAVRKTEVRALRTKTAELQQQNQRMYLHTHAQIYGYSLTDFGPARDPGVDGSEPTLARSNFKRFYSLCPPPQGGEVLLLAVKNLLQVFGTKHGYDWWPFYQSLYREAFKHSSDLRDNVANAATYLWTSAKSMRKPGDTSDGIELCSVINAAIRSDEPRQLIHACAIVRGINVLCVANRREAGKVSGLFPKRGVCFRGTGFNESVRGFFTPGKMVSSRNFLP